MAKKEIHQFFEIIAVLLSPVVFYIGIKQKNKYYKVILVTISIANFIVDAGLLIDAYIKNQLFT